MFIYALQYLGSTKLEFGLHKAYRVEENDLHKHWLGKPNKVWRKEKGKKKEEEWGQILMFWTWGRQLLKLNQDYAKSLENECELKKFKVYIINQRVKSFWIYITVSFFKTFFLLSVCMC